MDLTQPNPSSTHDNHMTVFLHFGKYVKSVFYLDPI